MVIYSYAVPLLLSVLFKHGYGVLHASYLDDVVPCKDFENKIVRVDLEREFTNEEELDYRNLVLTGSITLYEEIPEDTDLHVDIFMYLDSGEKEILYSYTVDLCNSFTDEKYPWINLWEQMDITECPVPAGKYEIKQTYLTLRITTDNFSERKQENFDDKNFQARARLEDRKTKNMISCHLFDFITIYDEGE